MFHVINQVPHYFVNLIKQIFKLLLLPIYIDTPSFMLCTAKANELTASQQINTHPTFNTNPTKHTLLSLYWHRTVFFYAFRCFIVSNKITFCTKQNVIVSSVKWILNSSSRNKTSISFWLWASQLMFAKRNICQIEYNPDDNSFVLCSKNTVPYFHTALFRIHKLWKNRLLSYWRPNIWTFIGILITWRHTESLEDLLDNLHKKTLNLLIPANCRPHFLNKVDGTFRTATNNKTQMFTHASHLYKM